MDYQNSVTLIVPKTFNELVNAIANNPSAVLFAGGTHLMSQPGYYPQENVHSYIYLGQIPELHKIQHTDKYLELGSMVTIRQLLNISSGLFSTYLYKAIESIGTSILRSQMTIGGALCMDKVRCALSCILCSMKAQVEIKFISNFGIFKKHSVHSRWISADKLYDSDGRFLYRDNAILTRIRIPSDQNTVLNFKQIGSVVHTPETAVIMALQYTISQDNLLYPNFCMSFINNGIFLVQDFDNIIRSLKFPLSSMSMQKVSMELKKMIQTECPKATAIQAERARRMILETLVEANNAYLDS